MTPDQALAAVPPSLHSAAIGLMEDLVAEQMGEERGRRPNPPVNRHMVALIGQEQAEVIANVGLSSLSQLTIAALRSLGLSDDSARRIRAAFTLAEAAARDTPVDGEIVRGVAGLERVMRPRLALTQEEELWMVYMDQAGGGMRVITMEMVGTMRSTQKTSTAMEYLVRRAIELGATSVAIAHNHPNGVCEPSDADIVFTYRLYAMFTALTTIALVDHVVIGRPGVFSFAENGIMDDYARALAAERGGGGGGGSRKRP